MSAATEMDQRLIELAGLEAGLVGRKAIEAALQRRMERTHSPTLSFYLAKFDTDACEREQWLEEVLIPETCFFRDSAPFDFLRLSAHTIRRGKAGRPLRVLSAPCSTGEEPYSAAMSLFEAGLLPSQFKIDAVDISAPALNKAQTALYKAGAFRGRFQEYRDKYFAREHDGFRLRADVRACVTFQRGNLASPRALRFMEKYDVILCRNLLIYMSLPARQRLIDTLHGLLAEHGVLIAGHADDLHRFAERFAPLPHPRACAFKKIAKPRATASARAQTAPPAAIRRGAAKVLIDPRSSASRNVASGSTPPSANDYQAALQLADQGRLAEAQRLLTRHLDAQPAHADGWFALGLVHESQSAASHAEACFNKALYLCPAHREALLHLSLLAERRGDHDLARRLKRRVPAGGVA
jgi:chemotaxis protein methyltransferase WspC